METRPEIETLITGIRQQIQTTEQAISDLQDNRQAALLAGDSARLDEIEAAAEQHHKENARRLERIALLDAELIRVDQRDRASYLEGIRQRALKAAQLGEETIRKEYAPAARKIAAALEKLSALRQAIDTANNDLTREGADNVPDFDAGRHVPGWQPPTVTETIRIDAQDRRHPRFEQYRAVYQNRTAEEMREILDRLGTVAIEETKTPPWESPTYAENLEATVNLPGIIGSDLPFWMSAPFQRQQVPQHRIDELLTTLLG